MKACLTAHVSAGGSSAFRTGSHTTTTLQRSATWWSDGGQRWASASHMSRLEYMLWCVIVCPLFALVIAVNHERSTALLQPVCIPASNASGLA